MALLLGLDIGTTSTVGIVIDSAGGTLALASRPVELHTPELNRAEEDPVVGERRRNLVVGPHDQCRMRAAFIAGEGVGE